MKSYRFLLIGIGVLLAGCLPVRPNFNPPQITQLQSRAIQTRTYEGLDQKGILKTVLNVLQDEGFIVHYGDTELGLLNARKDLVEYDRTNFSSQFSGSVANANAFTGNSNPQPVSTIEATANVSEFGQQTKVRLNFQRKVIGTVPVYFGLSSEMVIDVNPINDPKFYQEFFVKVDKALFIQKQGL